MSKIRAADLARVNLAASEAHSCEIRAAAVGSEEIREANLVEANLAAIAAHSCEIRATDLVKVNLAASEVDS
jgi:uncharacterized protein YjbI with pentapeptide repeats